MYWEVGGEEGWARQPVVKREKLYTKNQDFRQLYTFESSLVISDCFCRNVINNGGSEVEWDGPPSITQL